MRGIRNVVKFALLTSLAVALSGGDASAAPILQIQNGSIQEVLGDAGGTSRNNPLGSIAGWGIPTVNGGWADTPSFATEAGIGRGTTGYHQNTTGSALALNLTEPARVTFTFYGRGDSILADQFQLNTGSGYQTVFTGGTSGQGASITIDLPAGTIPFRYVTGPDPAHPEGPFTTTNGVNASAAGAHFFLGVDPYLASGTYQMSGTSVFVGLTDRPHGSGEDHDFQDLTILVQAAPLVVPEPATVTTALFLIGGGCVGVIRRRLQARHSATGAAAHS